MNGIEFIQQGGPMMWVLIICSVLVFVAFLERLFHLHRAQVPIDSFMNGIYTVLRKRNIPEAITLCEETPGPVANIVRSALIKMDEPTEVIIQAMRATGLSEIPRLEKRIALLATFATLAPILGLMGTLLGMMELFSQLNAEAPLVHIGDLGGGLKMALITTVFGMGVATVSYAAHNMLLNRVNIILVDMEQAAWNTLNFITQQRNKDREGLSA